MPIACCLMPHYYPSVPDSNMYENRIFAPFKNNPIMEPNLPVNLSEISASAAYGHGWQTLKKFIPELLLVFLLEMVVSLPVGLGSLLFNPELVGTFVNGLFNVAYYFIVLLPVSFGMSWVYLKAVRGEPFRPTDIFFSFQQFGQVILAGILMGVIIGIGVILFIIPGIIFACKLAFVPYLVMDEKLDATEAVRRSWEMTRGYAGTIFWMGILAFFVCLLGVICLIIGVIPAAILVSLAFASIYWMVSTKIKNKTSAPV
jgi:uncharacterized membrane protein